LNHYQLNSGKSRFGGVFDGFWLAGAPAFSPGRDGTAGSRFAWDDLMVGTGRSTNAIGGWITAGRMV